MPLARFLPNEGAMSEQPAEVVFCDLCGVSIADGELASGAAVRLAGKAIGLCCLRQLRPALDKAAATDATPSRSGTPGGAPAAASDSRLLSVAVLLLAALAAVTIYLDQKITGAHHKWSEAHGHLVEAQQAQGGLLGNLELTLGEFARQSSIDALSTRLQEATAGLPSREDADKQAAAVAQALAAIRQDLRTMGEGQIDYRPLFEDLRGRQQRLLEQVAALRDAAAAAPVAVTPVPPGNPPGPVDAAAPTSGLPAEQLEQVGKLRAADSSVRFIALDSLLKTKNPALLPHLLPMAKDGDAFVRRLAIDGLRDWKQASVVDTLLAALGDDDENVRDTAWSSLKLLTGQKLPFDAAGSKDARAKAAQRWQDWWDKNKATFGS